MRGLLFLIVSWAAALQPKFAEPVREGMKKYGVPPWAVVIDGVQHDTIAYTDADRQRTYIDFAKFANAPNSLKNVVNHELAHLRGRDHNNIPGDIMSYKLTVNTNGEVIDDARVWQ